MGRCEEQRKPTKSWLYKPELNLAFTKYAMKHFISDRHCSYKFWAEKGGKIWPTLDLCTNVSQEASKISQIGCAAATFDFLHIFSDFWSFILCLVNACSCPCISSLAFLLGISEYMFGRGNIFPLLTHAESLFLRDRFPHLAARHCLFLMPCFITNPQLYPSVSCMFLLGAIWSTLQTGDHNVYVTLEQRWGEGWKWFNNTQIWCSSLRRYKWFSESCSCKGSCHFRRYQQSHLTFFCPPPGAHAGLSRGGQWTQYRRIWAMIKLHQWWGS